jgi:DnaJ-class molecular chaperone
VSGIRWRDLPPEGSIVWTNLPMNSTDPYEVLGVRRGADRQEVRRAYVALARRFHPDVRPEAQRALLDDFMKKINWAYEELSR